MKGADGKYHVVVKQNGKNKVLAFDIETDGDSDPSPSKVVAELKERA